MSNDENRWTCLGCGANVESSGRFCTFCGRDRAPTFQTVQDPNVSFQPPMPSPFPQPVKKKRSPLIPLVIIGIVVILFLGLAYQGFIVVEGITKGLKTGDGEYTFEWIYEGRDYAMSLDISGQRFDYYADQNIERGFRSQYDYDYVKNFITSSDPVVLEVASNIETLADMADLDTLETLGLALAFVQTIPYSYDTEFYGMEDYWAYPVETLVQGTGDCEDTGFLYASIVEAMGTDAAIVIFDDHIAVGVANDYAFGTYYDYEGVDYYYCETTSYGWEIGEIPDGRGSAHIVDVS